MSVGGARRSPSPRSRSPRPPASTAGAGPWASGRCPPWSPRSCGWRSRPGRCVAGRAGRRPHPFPAAEPDGRRHGAVLRDPGHGVLRHRRVGGPVPAGRGLSATAAGLLLSINLVMIVPVNMVVPALTVRVRLQRPLLVFFLACYAVGWVGLWVSPLSVPWLWMGLLGVAMGTFAMVLTLIGLRSRTPETTAALSTGDPGWGTSSPRRGRCWSASCAASPAATPGCSCSSSSGRADDGHRLAGDPAAVRRRRGGVVPGWTSAGRSDDDVIEVAGAEPPATVHVRPDDGSPRG